MENEKNKTQNKKESNPLSASAQDAPIVPVSDYEDLTLEEQELVRRKLPNLNVQRKSFPWKGEIKYSYHIKVPFRGQPFNVELIPFDLGGYQNLIFIYGDADILPLKIANMSYRDKITKRLNVKYDYFITSSDGLEVQVKPQSYSDNDRLRMILVDFAARNVD